MNPTEAIPLLIVVLLLVSIGGGEVERMDVTFAGDHDVEAIDDVHVVAGGTTTVPSNASVAGDVYLIGGSIEVHGTVEGDLTVLAGNLTVGSAGTVTGTVEQYGGAVSIAEGATIDDLVQFDVPVASNTPARQAAALLLQFLALGLVGVVLVRRRPSLLENVGDAIVGHPLVSGVVGSLAAVTLLVLFVYMAFTIVLIPVSIVGLIAEGLIVVYGQVAIGYLVGRRLPIGRGDLATVAGIGVLVLFLEVLGVLPVIGAVVQLALVVVGFGAVVNTYFGLARFEPASIPSGASP